MHSNITQYGYSGGICGGNEGYTLNCGNDGDIKICEGLDNYSRLYMGGIIGTGDGSVSYCRNSRKFNW